MSVESKSSDIKKRTIRSFVLRAGRMTNSQQRAYQEQWATYGVDLKQGMVDFTELFEREAPVILEIGFGMGDSLIEMARSMPGQNFIGIDVHRPGVGRLLKLAAEHELNNIRVFCDDAVEVLRHCIPDASLHRVQLFFPDPWHKKKHHKRRIVQPQFMALVKEKTRIEGVFHAATDWENYAEQMMEVLETTDGWKNTQPLGAFAEKPAYRPVTKFEKRGERLGHGVWDLVFSRVE